MGGVEGVEKRRREGDQRATGALKRNSRRREGEREEKKVWRGKKRERKLSSALECREHRKEGRSEPPRFNEAGGPRVCDGRVCPCIRPGRAQERCKKYTKP